MFRNYLAAALNNLNRNRLYAAISILGLAVGMAAAILTGLYIRDELTFDHFIRGHDSIYIVESELQLPGRAHISQPISPHPTWQWLKQDFPGVETTARRISNSADVRHGDVEAVETVAWVDPDFFKLIPLKAIAGDPDAAVHQPDGVVLTRAMARKYFGRDTPVGETLQLRRSTSLRVRAVIEDLPHNTHLAEGIFISALATGSPQKGLDAQPYSRGDFYSAGLTYVRFKGPGEAALAAAGMPGLVQRHMMLPGGGWSAQGESGSLSLLRLDRMHFAPFAGSVGSGAAAQGDPIALWALCAVAALTLAMAAVNFVNLSTARAARRAVEVGVRKVAGAQRGDLVIQFIGEAMIYALLALVCAAALVELSLPSLNAALLRSMSFQVWRDPVLFVGLIGFALLLGLLAGLYPALVLSSFRPAQVLKGGAPHAAGSALVRSGLVTLQFAVLIGLILSTAVIVQQTRFALEDHLKTDVDQVLVMDLSPPNRVGAFPKPLCRDALIDQVRRLSGVRQAACSSPHALDLSDNVGEFILPNGQRTSLGLADADAGFFELYGVRPLAGRTFTRGLADEGGYRGSPPIAIFAPSVVLNETAARQIGFAEPGKAVNTTLRFEDIHGKPAAGPPAVVIGVVPDLAFDLIHGPVHPLIYFILTPTFNQLSIKLTRQDVRGTVAAIDQLWNRLGEPRAVRHRFLNEQLNTLYAGVIRQELLITALAGVAIFIACLGLFGMAAFTAERRTKEIGIRKAMGASRADITRLLLWQFTKPVLWASLIGLPVAWWAMDQWLHGFSARIGLQPWLFAAAPAAAMLIAWTTVLAHTVRVAGAKPIGALRYE